QRVSSSVFSMLEARPMAGRVIDESDEVPGGDPIVVLSHAMWQRYFAGDPEILGRRLTFNTVLGARRESSYTVVGVMPPSFVFPDRETLFWMPYAAAAAAPPPRGPVYVRLADGITIEAAAAELAPILRDVRGYRAGTTFELSRPRDELAAPVR